MPSNITLPEVIQDIALTERDITRLTAIRDNIAAFISDSGGEDRRAFYMDELRYASLLQQATKLLRRMNEVKATLKVESHGEAEPAPQVRDMEAPKC